MKKVYENPKCNVIMVNPCEIIATSPDRGGTGASGDDIPGDFNEDD